MDACKRKRVIVATLLAVTTSGLIGQSPASKRKASTPAPPSTPQAKKPIVYVVIQNRETKPMNVTFGVCPSLNASNLCMFSTMTDITTETVPTAHIPSGSFDYVGGLSKKVVLCPKDQYVSIITDRRYPDNGDVINCNVPELPDELAGATSVIYQVSYPRADRLIRSNIGGDSAPK